MGLGGIRVIFLGRADDSRAMSTYPEIALGLVGLFRGRKRISVAR